jgi:hypothetical protein
LFLIPILSVLSIFLLITLLSVLRSFTLSIWLHLVGGIFSVLPSTLLQQV